MWGELWLKVSASNIFNFIMSDYYYKIIFWLYENNSIITILLE